ncbi:hypothetical protein UFOVP190_323 [uncultured Caudovirales phage]|uniref:Uncharacterized protein n=1 Tax=uncultured Caudovirales phage TaxID=2100421 RepID=A0A6J7WPI8_9CAUD|nr:hypothetical protein UFOVP190_323 [uncultured Caudovirales phage]
MATRSCIGIKHGDVIKAIYCHFDGYIGYTGYALHTYYQSSPKVNKLISLGDLRMLGAEIGEEHDGHARDEYLKDNIASQCNFYSRDLGEPETETTWGTFHSDAEFIAHFDPAGVEYYYLYDHGVWYAKSYRGEFQPLHEVLARELDNKEKEEENA